MSNIQELEYRLNQTKQKLNELQQEVHAIEGEMARLKGGSPAAVSPYRSMAQQTIAHPTNNNQAYMQHSGQVPQNMQVSQNMYASQNVQMPQNMQPQGSGQNQQSVYMQGQQSASRPQRKGRESAEKIVGIKVMGIVASVLIFISFLLFAAIFVPALPDTAKMALMFMISSIMTAVGLVVWFNRKDSILFLSIAACGIGALYISLFVSNVYFGIIDKIPLYILIMIWAGGVLYLTRYKQRLFEIIGLTGIIISIIFGVAYCIQDRDAEMLIVLSIFFVVGLLAYMLIRLRDDITFIISSVAGILGTFLLFVAGARIIDTLSIGADKYIPNEVFILFGILGVLSIAFMVLNLQRINDKNYHYLPFFGFGYNLLLMGIMFVGSVEDEIGSILCLVVSVIVYIILEWYHSSTLYEVSSYKGKSVGIRVWQITLLVVAAVCISSVDILSDYISIFLLFLPLAVYAGLKDNLEARITALSLYGALIILGAETEPIMMVIYFVIGALITYGFMYYNKNEYNSVIKLLTYIFMQLGLGIYIAILCDDSMDSEAVAFIVIVVLGLINLLATKTVFGRSWLTNEDELSIKVTGYVINAVLMFMNLILMFDSYDELHILSVLTAVLLFTINAWNLIRSGKLIFEVYVAMKFTVLLICILASFDSPSYILSICVFALAVVIIILGFSLKLKSLRIYGLVTTMIFAVKLVMIDISYDNILGNALSFFISGVMCFGISALYSIADKKLSQ